MQGLEFQYEREKTQLSSRMQLVCESKLTHRGIAQNSPQAMQGKLNHRMETVPLSFLSPSCPCQVSDVTQKQYLARPIVQNTLSEIQLEF